MSIVSTGNLIDTLRQYRLLPADQLDQLPHMAQGRCGEVRPFVKMLAQRGWLTVYQINQILVGNARQLVIEPYRVLDRLGQGGLSEVFKARHAEHDWVVALKVIKPEVLTNMEGRLQFLQEMEAMARLDHPNIVQFCDADQVGETCYFAMEYIEGTDLGKHVRLSGPLPVPQACDFIRQAALGLQHAHERNLVHRDIKPVNLFLTQVPVGKPAVSMNRFGEPAKPMRTRAVVKILDWGLASLRNPKRGDGPVIVNNIAIGIMGTADYLSPEQARDANAVDIRGDLYSLGCTFYYLLTGQPPFPDGTLMQKIMQHQKNEPKPIDSFRGDVPSGVALILNRLLAKLPEARYQTPAALALALTPFVRDTGKVPGPDAVPNHRGIAPCSRRDDTPLPASLTSHPLPRVLDKHADTSCPQKR